VCHGQDAEHTAVHADELYCESDGASENEI